MLGLTKTTNKKESERRAGWDRACDREQDVSRSIDWYDEPGPASPPRLVGWASPLAGKGETRCAYRSLPQSRFYFVARYPSWSSTTLSLDA